MCDAENQGSARVEEKAAMSFEGLLSGYGFWKNEYRDIKLFSILRREYFERTRETGMDSGSHFK